ncbi:MAG: diaminopimelate epimerase [Gudongella sp.]|nr:diaminopimelate epimerase [Gudongella sp.]
MQFTKMHGAGNDFIIINNIVEKISKEKFADIASTLCKRRLSIGADGIMFVDNPTTEGDYRMHFFNADGTEGEMCGNGARCICRYGYENGLAGEKQRVETLSGIVEGIRIDKRNYRIKLNKPTVFERDYPLEFSGKRYDCSYVELGDPGLPHLVVELPGFQDMLEEDLYKIGKGLRSHKMLAKGANVNFISFDTQGNLSARTFERGVEDFTLACGTGAGSIGFALIKKERLKVKVVQVIMPGGILSVELEESDKGYEDIIISGPTNIVSTGIILDEELNL